MVTLAQLRRDGRAAPALRKSGIEIVFGVREGRARKRMITVMAEPENGGPIVLTVLYEQTEQK
jgi:hypothetical protein